MSRAKNFFKKLADAIGFELPSIEITPEREKEVIDMVVESAKRWGLADIAILAGSGFIPMSGVFAYTVALPWAPVLGAVFGIDNPWQYIAFLDNQENLRTIIKRLHEETK